MNQQKTCLNEWHREHGAKMVDFSGWNMPLNYGDGARAEHLMVRRSCGLFDISHMGRFLIHCDDAASLEEYEFLISSPVADLAVGTGSYGLLCKEDAGVLDDIFNFRLDDSTFLLVVNAANREKDRLWIESNSKTLKLNDVSDDIGMIAVQGPRALELLRAVGYGDKVDTMAARNSVSSGSLLDDGIFTRTGYTGEDGVEVYAPNAVITALWSLLLEQAELRGFECGPVGLAARDSLRFEPGYALYGHELTEELTAREALLKWACKLSDEQPDFMGKTALKKAYAQNNQDSYMQRTVKLIDTGMPRQNMRVVNDQGEDIGWVCSGMASPSLGGFYANIYIKRNSSQTGNHVYILIRNTAKTAEIVKRPIYSAV